MYSWKVETNALVDQTKANLILEVTNMKSSWKQLEITYDKFRAYN